MSDSRSATLLSRMAPSSDVGCSRRIMANFSEFDNLVKCAQAYYAKGDVKSAAVVASWAADIATGRHCGLFMSPRLENLLTRIGRESEHSNSTPTRPRNGPVRRVLHVSTRLFSVGGHSRMLRRWIESDSTRVHSIAVTQQQDSISADIVRAATASGGQVYAGLNRRPGGLFSVVKQLRELAIEHDIVVLHVGNSDVVPSIAFAATEKYPPVLFLNHADHLFWVGVGVSHIVGSMRNAALDLAETRRRVAKERNVLIPILVEPTKRKLTRSEAKTALGIAPQEVALVSAARPEKYRTFCERTYADLHTQVLLKHPNATLYILGAGERHDWKDAIARVQNRIVPLPLQDPRLFMEAADIYLDSYPFCSATSMMEAAGYGTPCVTRFLLSDQARICGMDHPGLAGPLIEVSNEIDYQKKISDLIADGDLRRRIGEEIFHSVAEYNVPPAWSQFIENAFAQATALAPVDNLGLFPDDDIERPFLGEPDCRIEERYGIAHPKHHLLKEHLSDFPLSQRLIHWRRLILDGGFVSAKEAARCLMPEWAVRILKNGF